MFYYEFNENTFFEVLKYKYKDLVDLNEYDIYSDVDFYIPSKDLYIEIKCRNRHYDNLFLEKLKYDKLVSYSNVIYISTTPLGVWFWNIHKLDPVWINREMNKTSHFSNRNVVNKLVAELNVNDGVNITDDILSILKKLNKV